MTTKKTPDLPTFAKRPGGMLSSVESEVSTKSLEDAD